MADSPPPSPPVSEPPAASAAASGITEKLATGEFFVVGIGASAGGLEAVSEVLKRLPLSTNLAVVLVQHLDPHHESILVDVLDGVAGLPVQWATNGRSIEPGHVYVAPPRHSATIQQGVLVLRDASVTKLGGDIDFFFNSLARDARHRAVGVILSGNGKDGTLGAKAIKQMGGIILAQEPSTAAFPSMPQSAIDSQCADQVLAPKAIAEELVKMAQTAEVFMGSLTPDSEAPANKIEADHLTAIFRLLMMRTGVDFSEYKQSTIKRRLARQMMLAKIGDLGDYAKFLHKNRAEVDRLYESLLINVTEFFRDAEYFDFLRASVLPEILPHRPENAPLRLWVPGVATGEEVYSLGIIIRELMEEKGQISPVQIFGTDVSDRAIAHARVGLYTAADVANVTPERLKRYFYRTERGYLIQKPIRDMCIFARQNVGKDSPFSRIDLISCRNLLIYLSPRLQRKLMPIFHYALNPAGYLVLGSSESVAGHAELFRLVDRRYRIYSRKSTSRRPSFEFTVDAMAAGKPLPTQPLPPMSDELKEPFDVVREADRIVLNRHGPCGVLVNEELEILQFRGDVSPYLAPGAGRASLNLLKMARQGLAAELQAIMQEVREKSVRVRRGNITVLMGEATRMVEIDVTPIETIQSKEHFFLVLFTPVDAATPAPEGEHKPKGRRSADSMHADQMRQELEATRNYLQATIEKHEATNQELRAANEEIQSSNEELQSTNEELETAKEELQSTNEELTTVNEELHSRQLELIQVNNDLTNLINSVHLPIIILGQDMRIRRFTPMAERVLNVIPTDIGRPFSDINTKLNITNLPELMNEVVESLTIKELEVQDKQGRWYSMRLRPYKTSENRIEGVVITLIDIDQMKRTISELEAARDFAQAVIETLPEPLAALDQSLHIEIANDAFARLFHTSREAAQGRGFFELAHDHDGVRDLRAALEGIIVKSGSLTDHVASFDLPSTGATRVAVTARQIVSGTRSYPLMLLSLRPLPAS